MEVNWIDVVLSAALLFGALKAEQFYRIWRWKRSRKTLSPAQNTDESTKGLVIGAAEAVPCGRCGKLVKNFYEYADGDHWCQSCDANEID